MIRIVLVCIALAQPVPSAWPLAALGPADAAARTAKQAEELWRDGHYGEASSLLERAYEQHPEPAYLYARASVEADAGHCEVSVRLFEKFLGTDPPEVDAAAAREAMAPCQAELEANAPQPEPEPEPEPELEPDAGPEPDPETPTPRADRPPRKDLLGGVLVGAGALFVVGGAASLGYGVSTHANAGDAATADAFVDQQRKGRVAAGVGIGLLAVGVALATAGAVRYGLLVRRSKSTQAVRSRRSTVRWSADVAGVGVRF